MANCKTYDFFSPHTMDHPQIGGLFMQSTEQALAPAITVTRNFLGQQTAEALLLELIRAHTQAA